MRRAMNRLPLAIAMAATLVCTVAITGCASSLSGVGGTEGFACQAPVGAQCTSISGVYANANALSQRSEREALPPVANLLASTRKAPMSTMANVTTPAPASAPGSGVAVVATPSSTPAALRSPPRVLRLWVAPWEDSDGDLHDASLLHVVVDTGRWLVERVRPAPRNRVDVALPPPASPAAPAAPATSPTGARPEIDQPSVEP